MTNPGRLRRSTLTKPGLSRRRQGTGFSYRDADGRPIRDADTLRRIRALVIPPAWKDVWISPDPRGHIQATGVDDAGRKQYRYHDDWRAARDAKKFDRVLEAARHLPGVRARVRRDLTGGDDLSRERVLAASVRMLDLGLFRVGGEEYAARDEDPSFGLSTLRADHLTISRGAATLCFPGKSGVEHCVTIEDELVNSVLSRLKKRRHGGERLLVYRDADTGRWAEVSAETINAYLREVSHRRMTAKDFRTWHGTVEAASALAASGQQPTRAKRRRVVSRAMKQVAEALGNTPAVARASYVDPRIVEHYEEGGEIRTGSEREVRELLEH
ncbi:DNA topoisomerase IB [Catenuloplanes atrovinosus]|uniref:DNA topoisomerase n=1 Tax=Catenuloplanes atrovinosus TaxID=137266 RepID=A0AAE4CC23_9ACTN|nr:DNA topoisomerase IB [Catenuloplanes atrovinosus]MDR7277529.1 DNA topoisomerase IB [Catenuloplanes atrovinosus]